MSIPFLSSTVRDHILANPRIVDPALREQLAATRLALISATTNLSNDSDSQTGLSLNHIEQLCREMRQRWGALKRDESLCQKSPLTPMLEKMIQGDAVLLPDWDHYNLAEGKILEAPEQWENTLFDCDEENVLQDVLRGAVAGVKMLTCRAQINFMRLAELVFEDVVDADAFLRKREPLGEVLDGERKIWFVHDPGNWGNFDELARDDQWSGVFVCWLVHTAKLDA